MILSALSACSDVADTPTDQPPNSPRLNAEGVALEELTLETATGNHLIYIEIPRDEESLTEGLMGRPPLPDDEGMLFVFDSEEPRSFWMKDTPSSLDIIYLDSEGIVVALSENAVPNSTDYLPSVEPMQYALELRGGRAEELSIEVGDRAESLELQGSKSDR